MALQPVDGGSGGVAQEAYTLVGSTPTSRVRSDNTTQDVILVTAQSSLYLVTFSWFVTPAVWNGEARTAIIGPMTANVNEICGYRHVQGFRSEQDLDASQLLINNGVITVGTDDGSILSEVRVRMDHLNDVATFKAIDDAWSVLAAAGAS
jgi:hypothetical protein